MRESKIFKGEKAPLLFGHRGCPQLAPENSLSSFQKVLDHSVPGVELDVQLCASGELVVYHDSNTKRTTGYDGLITEMELSQIRELDNGSFFSAEFKGEKIPLFEEVLQLLGHKVYYDIEIKADNFHTGGIEKKVLEMIYSFQLQDRVIVSSFNPFALKRFNNLKSGIPSYVIYSNDKEVPYWLRKGQGKFISKPNGLKPDQKILTASLQRKLEKKYPIMSWTVDDEQLFCELRDRGIEGLCTNRADYFNSGKFID